MISPFSSFTSAEGARKPLGSMVSPEGRETIEPIIPKAGGRRMRTCKPGAKVSVAFGMGGLDEIGS